MDVTLQRHCARYIYVVPDGLRELSSDISREVLRAQPEDLYVFIADYLDALLITRENARIAAKFVQHMTEAAETIVSLLQRTSMSRDQVDKAAGIIQTAFKTWSERKGILKEDDEIVVNRIIEEAGISEGQIQIAAAVIQKAFKMYKTRLQRESQLLSGIIDWRVAARSAIKLYRKTGVSPEEAKKAATLIKAAYKGYYTRKAMKQLNEEISYEESYEEEEEEEEEEEFYEDLDEQKSKGVRINFESVLPHVDFDEDKVNQETALEEEIKQIEEAIEQQASQYILELLQDIIDCVVTDDHIKLPVFDDKDSEHDSFLPPLEDTDEPEYNKGVLLPLVSQEELEKELVEVKHEVKGLMAAKGSQTVVQKQPSDLIDKEEGLIGFHEEDVETEIEET